MASEAEIKQALDIIPLPVLGRTLGSLNMLRSLQFTDRHVSLELAITALDELSQRMLQVQINKELKNLPGIDGVEVVYVESKPAELNEIGHVIAVMSGKGGVGKSVVSGLIATGLRRKGFNVGILDADITGPSIPRMFGLTEKPIGCRGGFLPVFTSSGIAVMSINLVLENEDEAVIWRGPLIANAIIQFWEGGFWGKLDYMIVDLPPGTADAPLTVIKSLPVSGLVIVSTPQELASMIVKKAINMARNTGSHILGVIENMSYLYLNDIDRRIEVFGPSRGEQLAQAAGAPLLAQIPIDTSLAKLCDEGRIEEYSVDISQSIVDALLDSLSKEPEGKGKNNDGQR